MTKSDEYGYLINLLTRDGTNLTETLLQIQAYPNFAGIKVWHDLLQNWKDTASAHVREMATFPDFAHEDAETIYDYLTQRAFGEMGLYWLSYGSQEGLVDLDKIKAELRAFAEELYSIAREGINNNDA